MAIQVGAKQWHLIKLSHKVNQSFDSNVIQYTKCQLNMKADAMAWPGPTSSSCQTTLRPVQWRVYALRE